jgi:hypothetical protein
VTEVLNRMLRDQWLRHVETVGTGEMVELTQVGERLLGQLLARPGASAGER